MTLEKTQTFKARLVYDQWLARREVGEAEPFDEFLARYPDLREELIRAAEVDKAVLDAFRESGELPATEPGPARTPGSIVGRQLGDFRILHEIGRGGMGIVFEAEQLSLHRRVALKVLPAQLTLNDRALKRFRQEAEITGRLHHRGIIDIHQVGEQEGIHFIAMELIEGSSLDRVIDRMRGESFQSVRQEVSDAISVHGLESAPVPKKESGSAKKGSSSAANKNYIGSAVKLVRQVAQALQHAHEAGVLHRDIKPSNILVRQDGNAVLTDFGLARQEGLPSISATGEFAGTPHYVSPEQAMGGRVPLDHRADVFSLGATLYEILTLERAFHGSNTHQVLSQIISKSPVNPQKLNNALAPDLVTIILKALEKDPDQRYQSAGELAEDLEAFVQYRPIHAKRTPTAVRAMRWVRREPIKAVLSVALVVGIPSLIGLSVKLLGQQPVIAASEQAELLQLAFLDLGAGMTSSAAERFKEAFDVNPGSPEVVAGRALSLLRLDDEDAALEVLDTMERDEGLLDRVRIDALRAAGRDEEASEVASSLQELRDPFEFYIEAYRCLYINPVDPNVERDDFLQRKESAAKACKLLRNAVALEDRAAYDFTSAYAAWLADDEEEARYAVRVIEHDWSQNAYAQFYAGVAKRVYDPKGAQRSFEEALKLDPGLWMAKQSLGGIALELRQFERAIALFKENIEMDPESADAHANLAAAYFFAGLHEQAIATADVALSVDPTFVHALDTKAGACLQLGRFIEARDLLIRAVAAEPKAARLYFDMGLALMRLGQWVEAGQRLQTGLKLYPEKPEGTLNLGIVLLQAGDLNGALAYLQNCEANLDLADGDFPTVQVYDLLGGTLFELERYGESIAPLRKVLELDPGWVDTRAFNDSQYVHRRALLVESCMRVGRWEEGLAEAVSWCEANDASLAWNWRARIQVDPNRPPEFGSLADALAAARKAVDKAPRDLVFQETLARAHSANGDLDEAFKVLVEAQLEAVGQGLADMVQRLEALGIEIEESQD